MSHYKHFGLRRLCRILPLIVSVTLSLTVLREFVHCLFPLYYCQTHSYQSVQLPPQTVGVWQLTRMYFAKCLNEYRMVRGCYLLCFLMS